MSLYPRLPKKREGVEEKEMNVTCVCSRFAVIIIIMMEEHTYVCHILSNGIRLLVRHLLPLLQPRLTRKSILLYKNLKRSQFLCVVGRMC